MGTRTRTTHACNLDLPQAEEKACEFRNGIIRAGRYMSNADRGAFKQPYTEMFKKHTTFMEGLTDEPKKRWPDHILERMERHQRLTGYPTAKSELGDIIRRTLKAMPYLVVLLPDQHTAFFYHHDRDYPVGYITSRSNYCMKAFSLFSPLTSDKQRGGTSSDDPDKIVSEARRVFKFKPPSNVLTFLAMEDNYAEFIWSFRRLIEKGQDRHRSLKQYAGCQEAHNFFSSMFAHKPEMFKERLPETFEMFDKRQNQVQKVANAIEQLSRVAYVLVTGTDEDGKLLGKMMFIDRPYLKDVQTTDPTSEDFVLDVASDNRNTTAFESHKAAPLSEPMQIPDELVVKITLLGMREKNEAFDFVKELGQRLSDSQYMLYANDVHLVNNLGADSPDKHGYYRIPIMGAVSES